ncbi:glycosyltransferase [Clostridium hydrogenum]|uniref:glycosyltransferase n=1 Tax=Clostridium hydrogenum TaxID=2855764 RepID=UPI001F3B7621|nr:glycosyltransferase [Clostridium hydrogenum]
MIVKNEEENLPKCLNSIKSKVDEIIIVDTGSTDKTMEVAKRYTDKVFNFEWCDDFSAARNFSINKAKNDWILILDADEVVNFFNKKDISRFINKNKNVVGRIKRINTFEDSSGKKKFFERVNRLFNKKFFKYEGIIHEQVVSITGENYTTENIDVYANHIGYEKEILNRTNKIKRNKELLEKAIEMASDDPYLQYQLGKTFFMEKDYVKAEVNLSTAIRLGIDAKYEYVQDLIESYGYTLINLKKYKEALILKKYEEFYNSKSDFNFVMGLIYMNNAMFKEAVNKFIQCQNSKECKIEGVNSYLANYNIGVIYECLGILNEAVKYYKKCGNYKLAVGRIKAIKLI